MPEGRMKAQTCPFMRLFRMKRAFLHFVIVLIGAGHIGCAARTCVLGTCHGRLISVLTLVAVGTLSSLIISFLLFANVAIIGKYEYVIDIVLCLAWGTVVGLTMFIVETLFTHYATAMAIFAWLGLGLCIVALSIALLGPDGPFSPGYPLKPSGAHPARGEFSAMAVDEEADEEDNQRDATPELPHVPHADALRVQLETQGDL